MGAAVVSADGEVVLHGFNNSGRPFFFMIVLLPALYV